MNKSILKESFEDINLEIGNVINLRSYKKRIDDALFKIFGKKLKKFLLINPPDNKETFDFDRANRKRNSDYLMDC